MVLSCVILGASSVQTIILLSHDLFCPLKVLSGLKLLFLLPIVLPRTQAAKLNASFGWSMRPGDAMRPSSRCQKITPALKVENFDLG
jgi:hypothetical protein